MSKQDFISLYEKVLSGKCSVEEKQLLENYYAEIKLMDNEWEDKLGDEAFVKKIIAVKIKAASGIQMPAEMKKRFSPVWLGYAASALFILTAGFFAWQYLHKGPANPIAINRRQILPGKNQAFLTLANGRSIGLHDRQNGKIAGVPGMSIQKVNDSILTYSYNNAYKLKSASVPDSNLLTIPRGGIFQTILSDGTKVWLNSASSLKYPVAFSGKERRVILSGEAYFEVAKNKQMPFKVVVKGVDIQVLGTHFNVSGYPDEKEIKTTLLEGSVKLHSSTGHALLVPGQQGVYSIYKPGFKVNPVNTADAIAWKDGFFVFDNENIQNIMMKIGRWYNVEVDFQNKLNQKSFGGTISRYKDIDVVLQALQTTGSVHFKIAGRRVFVMD